MSDITKEIEDMAETLEKSSTDGFTDLKETILELGPEGLKKALPTLDADQKILLEEALQEMAKARSLDAVTSTTSEGEQYKNTTKDFDEEDEEVAKEAPATQRNQGGVPIEGWEGQVIKSESADLTAMDQERGEVAETLKKSDEVEEKKEMKEVASKEAKQEVAAHNDEKHSGQKAKFKKSFQELIKSGTAKNVALPALAKRLDASYSEMETMSELWDSMAKAMSYKYDDSTTGKDNPEKGQVDTPETLPEKKANKPGGEPGCPAPKSSSTTSEDVKNQTKETADEAVAQAPAIKKSEDLEKGRGKDKQKRKSRKVMSPEEQKTGNHRATAHADWDASDHENAAREHSNHATEKHEMYQDAKAGKYHSSYLDLGKEVASHDIAAKFHKEQAKSKMAKSEQPEFNLTKSEDPFSVRKIGQNTHFNVDEYIAAEAVETFQKSTFDYEHEDLNKGRGKDKQKRKVRNSEKTHAEYMKESHAKFEGETIAQVGERTKALREKRDKERATEAAQDKKDTAIAAEKRKDAPSLLSLMKSNNDILEAGEDLSKSSGAGSRGGKVIGKTRSGKPIYDSASHSSHSGFTKQDHNDAAKAQNKLEDEHQAKHSDNYDSPEYKAKADHHYGEAEKHKAAGKKAASANGPRAANKTQDAVAHTSSGKPVRQKFGSADHKDFTGKDHHEAYAAHGRIIEEKSNKIMELNREAPDGSTGFPSKGNKRARDKLRKEISVHAESKSKHLDAAENSKDGFHDSFDTANSSVKMPKQGSKLTVIKSNNDILEAGEDLSKSNHIQQVAEGFKKSSGAFLVKSFNDSDLDLAINPEVMWGDENAEPGKLEISKKG